VAAALAVAVPGAAAGSAVDDDAREKRKIMEFNRIHAKRAAKQSIAGAEPSPLLVTLIFLLLTTGISTIIGQFVTDPFSEAVEYIYQWGYDPEEVLEYVWDSSSQTFGLYSLISLLFSLYSAAMTFGYLSYTLRLARREGSDIPRLFDGFSRFGRVLWLNILTNVFTFLWGILGGLPGIVLMFAGALGQNYTLIMGSTLLMATGMMAAVLWAALRYALAPYFLLDNLGCTALEAIAQSKQAMRGWKLEYMMLQLSFFGWFLLAGVIGAVVEWIVGSLGNAYTVGSLAGSVILLWLNPYLYCTQANFYDAVTGHIRLPPPVGGYNSNYGYYGDSDGGPGNPPLF